MNLLKDDYIDASGIRLHYYRSGGDKQTIILAHGFSDNGACWASMFPELTADYDVIAYDARAHGRSEAPLADYNSHDQADDLLGLIDVLGLQKPILMGHSMGGQTAGWATIKRPEMAAALIFEDSGISGPIQESTDDEARRMREGMVSWITSLQTKTVDELVAICREDSPMWPEEDYLPWAESKLQLNMEAVSHLSMATPENLNDFFPEISCPVLFLKADADEKERLRHRQIVATLPNGQIEHVKGAGHNVRRDQHDRTVKILKKFLDNL